MNFVFFQELFWLYLMNNFHFSPDGTSFDEALFIYLFIFFNKNFQVLQLNNNDYWSSVRKAKGQYGKIPDYPCIHQLNFFYFIPIRFIFFFVLSSFKMIFHIENFKISKFKINVTLVTIGFEPNQNKSFQSIFFLFYFTGNHIYLFCCCVFH